MFASTHLNHTRHLLSVPEFSERICGRALSLFLATCALRERFDTTGLGSGHMGADYWVVVTEVMMWLSTHTEWRAWCSCWESCEVVYCRMFTYTVSL